MEVGDDAYIVQLQLIIENKTILKGKWLVMKRIFLVFMVILALSFASGAWAAPGDSADNPIFISTPAELDAVRNGMDKYYKLSNDIDLTSYLAPGGAGYAKWGDVGWEPIANAAVSDNDIFTGNFDGNGHKISGLRINRNAIGCVGLFGLVFSADIKNLGVEIADRGVTGGGSVGGLVGSMYYSSITNCYAMGNVSGELFVGGLVGDTYDGSITYSYVIGNVSGSQCVGGLAGVMDFSSVTNSYATGNVNGGIHVGGLVGNITGSSITNCYSTCNVTGGASQTGGLVGSQRSASITSSYATGNVSGGSGLVGEQSSSSITNSYATGNVSGGFVGGLVGDQMGSSITNSYATGNVNGSSTVGGLVGRQYAFTLITGSDTNTITNSYVMGNVSGSESAGGLVGYQDDDYGRGINIIISSYRYQYATVNGVALSVNTPNGVHGGIKTMNELLTKTTYTDNGWLFVDSAPTAGPWYWDGIGYPKLIFETVTTPVIAITTQPAENTTVTAGSITGNLSVTANVTPSGTLTYQWHSNNTNSNSGGTSISGATSANFPIPTNLTAGTYYYYCVVSATGATPESSSVARVVVTDAPIITPVITITTQPTANTTVTEGSITGSLSVGASITQGGTLTYQLHSNNTNSNSGGTSISGATNASFTIPTNLAVGTYYYYCVASATGAVSVTSNVARVTVEDGNGCNSIGYGSYLVFALLGAAPFIIKKKKLNNS